MTEYIDVDVRPILRAGGEPFSVIMSALERLEPGQGLRLYAPFKPVPLFAVMADKGFAHSEQALDAGEWEVLFTPAAMPNRRRLPPSRRRSTIGRRRPSGSTTATSILRNRWSVSSRPPSNWGPAKRFRRCCDANLCSCSRNSKSAAIAGLAGFRRTAPPTN